jgi:hypothetical protein
MIEDDVATAFIMEDDGDWDLRLKDQLTQFAVASRALGQHVARSSAYADPARSSQKPMQESHVQFDFNNLPRTEQPKHSPYGDHWDLLWFGHCASRFPNRERDSTQTGRVVLQSDPSVVQMQQYSRGFGSDEWEHEYENHTRVFHHTAENACTSAYAITQNTARRMLYQFSIVENLGPIDMQMRKWCDGLSGYNVHNCYTTTPTYFEQWRARGNSNAHSDISDFDGYTDHAFSPNIRYSVKLNLERLLENDKLQPLDQYPDQ